MQLKGKHLMVDFETMDVEPTAKILSAGLVLFDYTGILRKGYSEFNINTQEGRTERDATIEWWERTNKDEFERLKSNGKKSLSDWVKQTRTSLNEVKPRKIWSRGSMDYLILQNLFGEELFPFWKFRDVRTLDEFGFTMGCNNHNALIDCINQVKYVYKVFGGMRKK